MIKLPEDNKIDMVPAVPCDHKHKLTRLIDPLRDWYPNLFFYFGCICNELVALHNRHLIQKVVATPDCVGEVSKYWLSLLPKRKFGMATEREVIEHAKPSRRQRVRRAFEDLAKEGLTERDSRIRSFVKHEKGELDLSDPPENKAPRLIQYRSFKFTSYLKRHLLPIEDFIFRLGERVPGVITANSKRIERLFSKGMDSWQVGNWINHAWHEFHHPVADLWDVSRMDAHMGPQVRERIEFATYRHYGLSINECLDSMRRNKCKTRNGIRYRSNYTMCSGEACTSLGDSIVMCAVLQYMYRNIHRRILVNGDDCIVIRERSDVVEPCFEQCGFPIKHEVADTIEHVEFCQCRPVRCLGRYRMVRNPMRVLTRAIHTIKDFIGDVAYGDWLSSVGMGELACNNGVPVLQAFAEYLIKFGAFRQKFYDDYMKFRGDVKTIRSEITDDARIDFAVAWGIMPDDQRSLETELHLLGVKAVPYKLAMEGFEE